MESIAIVVLSLVIAAGLGYGYSRVTNTHDSRLEELAEEFVEGKLEAALGLEDGELEGVVDLTPTSPEVINIDIK